ncbi:Uncharacterized protein APZ42_002484 [Daphnia magna]|uniref:Uncharacterized protein n=1 Tax=Daphnia magna TaxID=35525 RepID=A0A164I8I2_9CRUS|nr:Uncharacterized protein APZ42_002484 [Daphnia magna]
MTQILDPKSVYLWPTLHVYRQFFSKKLPEGHYRRNLVYIVKNFENYKQELS